MGSDSVEKSEAAAASRSSSNPIMMPINMVNEFIFNSKHFLERCEKPDENGCFFLLGLFDFACFGIFVRFDRDQATGHGHADGLLCHGHHWLRHQARAPADQQGAA
ncbi:MAG: hypothetical protein MHM6MM_007141 [Cercozoa sp. M6MM]